MARKKQTIRLKSDYTIRRKTNNPNTANKIVEQDYNTLTKHVDILPDQILLNSDESNFNLTIRVDELKRRKSINNPWEDEASSAQTTTITSDGPLDFKPDYSRLDDFVYYGSASKLFEACVTETINKFPAELYFSNDSLTISGNTYYIVSNEFGIDIEQTGLTKEEITNQLRNLELSLSEYYLVSNGVECEIIPETYRVETKKSTCKQLIDNGDFVSEVYFSATNGVDYHLRVYQLVDYKTIVYLDRSLIGTYIRPKKEHLDTFYDEICPFNKIMLNRQTNPKYKMELETPFENEYGEFYDLRTYVWPSINNYNPQLNSIGYKAYINGMLDLCQYYDENYSDNSYRNLTHEALKNLDWTFLDKNKEDDNQVGIDSTRIDVLNRIYGRQYDDIKYYIDGLKCTNNLSYNSKNNASDYFVEDIANDKGIDFGTFLLDDDSEVKTEPLYDTESDGYNSEDAMLRLLKNISLNYKYLSSIKGTRKGIETMLSLFGFDIDDIEMREYVIVAKNNEAFDPGSEIGLKYPLVDEVAEYNLNKDTLKFDKDKDTVDILEGLPLNLVTVYDENDNMESYVIPWYINGRKYDGDLYFQMKGGWGKTDRVYLNTKLNPDIEYLEVFSSDFKFYGDTEPLIEYVSDINDLKDFTYKTKRSKMICYVSNLNKLFDDEYKDSGLYIFKDDAEKEAMITNSGCSNYFILENEDVSDVTGYSEIEEKYGWRNILKSEYNCSSALTEDGKWLLYLDSVKENNIGNNPHIGHFKYDDGQEYIDYLMNPFKWSLENDNFSAYEPEQIEYIKTICFKPEKQEDNRKCWFFTNIDNINTELLEKKESVYELNRIVSIGTHGESNFMEGSVSKQVYSSKMNPFNPENGAYNDEPAANSVVNIKNIDIKIIIDNFYDETKKFFMQHVLPYLYYMLPSTSICSVIVKRKKK